MSIKENIDILREEIRKSSLKVRSVEEIVLVAVTKTVDVERIKEVVEEGILNIGENRIQEAKQKYLYLNSLAIKWHMVGHLQTNKVKDAVKIFSLIHSVDSFKLAKEIDLESKKINKVTSILLEVNVSHELTKFGFKCEEVLPFLKEAESLDSLKILGLMTVAPVFEVDEEVRPIFRKLKVLFDEIKKSSFKNVKMQYLSMGMSSDFKMAIEEGSNMIRIGTAIFGERKV
ncbi:MAG: YggS family pyridoxal phosphate-dependent enzyme [Candidatus Firestonebacteria bacterium]